MTRYYLWYSGRRCVLQGFRYFVDDFCNVVGAWCRTELCNVVGAWRRTIMRSVQETDRLTAVHFQETDRLTTVHSDRVAGGRI